MKYSYPKNTFTPLSIIVKILKGIWALFKLIIYILSIPYEIYKGVEEVISTFKSKPKKA